MHCRLRVSKKLGKMLCKVSALCVSAAAALFLAVPTAFAQDGVNQLQMARLPQQVQRAEFPLVGEESAFKFNFFEDVRTHTSLIGLGLNCHVHV